MKTFIACVVVLMLVGVAGAGAGTLVKAELLTELDEYVCQTYYTTRQEIACVGSRRIR